MLASSDTMESVRDSLRRLRRRIKNDVISAGSITTPATSPPISPALLFPEELDGVDSPVSVGTGLVEVSIVSSTLMKSVGLYLDDYAIVLKATHV